jgi:hypothetical protein
MAGLTIASPGTGREKLIGVINGYHEDLTTLAQNVFAPRNFRANTATLVGGLLLGLGILLYLFSLVSGSQPNQ